MHFFTKKVAFVLILTICLIFTLGSWIFFQIFGYDWVIHFRLASLLESKTLIDNISWNEWYKYTPGTAIILQTVSKIVGLNLLDSIKILSVTLATFLFSLLTLVSFKLGQKWWIYVPLFVTLFGGFELVLYVGSLHSQLLGFIFIILFILLIKNKKYFLAHVVFIITAITFHMLSAYILFLACAFFMLMSRTKKFDLYFLVSGLIILFFWTVQNVFARGLLSKMLAIDSLILLTFSVLLLFTLTWMAIFLLKRFDPWEKLIQKMPSIKVFFFGSLFLSLALFIIGFWIFSSRHGVSFLQWIFTNLGRLALIPLIILGIYQMMIKRNEPAKFVLALILALVVMIAIGLTNYLPFQNSFSSLGMYPMRALILLSIPFSLVVAGVELPQIKKLKIYFLFLVFILLFYFVSWGINPLIFNDNSNLPPHSFSNQEITSLDFINTLPKNYSPLWLDTRFNVLLESKSITGQVIEDLNLEGVYIITKTMEKYGLVVSDKKPLFKLEINKYSSKNLIYNNGTVLIVQG